jgi:hypothetical protein
MMRGSALFSSAAAPGLARHMWFAADRRRHQKDVRLKLLPSYVPLSAKAPRKHDRGLDSTEEMVPLASSMELFGHMPSDFIRGMDVTFSEAFQ